MILTDCWSLSFQIGVIWDFLRLFSTIFINVKKHTPLERPENRLQNLSKKKKRWEVQGIIGLVVWRDYLCRFSCWWWLFPVVKFHGLQRDLRRRVPESNKILHQSPAVLWWAKLQTPGTKRGDTEVWHMQMRYKYHTFSYFCYSHASLILISLWVSPFSLFHTTINLVEFLTNIKKG